MGAIGTRLSLRPLFERGRNELQNSDASCRENAELRPHPQLSSPGLPPSLKLRRARDSWPRRSLGVDGTGRPSTPRPFRLNSNVSGILDHPHARVMTPVVTTTSAGCARATARRLPGGPSRADGQGLRICGAGRVWRVRSRRLRSGQGRHPGCPSRLSRRLPVAFGRTPSASGRPLCWSKSRFQFAPVYKEIRRFPAQL
jgi:hypothetical protein